MTPVSLISNSSFPNGSTASNELRDQPDSTMHDLDGIKNSVLSKGQVLGLCDGVYDPIEVASPYTIKLKLHIRDTLMSQDRSDFSATESWDKFISQSFVGGPYLGSAGQY